MYFAAGTGSRIVAEGIEPEAECATLQGLGISLGQGCLFGRPGPASGATGGQEPNCLPCPGIFTGRVIHLVVEMSHQIRG